MLERCQINFKRSFRLAHAARRFYRQFSARNGRLNENLRDSQHFHDGKVAWAIVDGPSAAAKWSLRKNTTTRVKLTTLGVRAAVSDKKLIKANIELQKAKTQKWIVKHSIQLDLPDAA